MPKRQREKTPPLTGASAEEFRKKAKISNETNGSPEPAPSSQERFAALQEQLGEEKVDEYLKMLGDKGSRDRIQEITKEWEYDKMWHIQCPVHGQIQIEKDLACIIDTPEFQRLRRVKQLGMASRIYPSAKHDRFCHSLGVYHICKKLMNNIRTKQNLPNFDRKIQFVICTAALVHDIGHGPFSHTFEMVVKKINLERVENGQGGCDVEGHEKMGGRILDHMWKKHANIREVYTQEDFELIKALMEPDDKVNAHVVEKWSKRGLKWIFRTISAAIDVDKMDYLCRDGYHSGVGEGSGIVDINRILASARVIGEEIAYEDKTFNNVVDMLQKRWRFHKLIYQHKSNHAFDILLTHTLKEYFKVQGIERLADVEFYTKLDDTILGEIRRSDDPALEKAQAYLNKMDFRRQPRLLWESTAIQDLSKLKQRYETETDLAHAIEAFINETRPEKYDGIHVKWGQFGLGKVPGDKHKHSLEAIPLYKPKFPNKFFYLGDTSDFSLVGVGSKDKEFYVMVFCWKPDDQEELRKKVEEFGEIYMADNIILEGTCKTRQTPKRRVSGSFPISCKLPDSPSKPRRKISLPMGNLPRKALRPSVGKKEEAKEEAGEDLSQMSAAASVTQMHTDEKPESRSSSPAPAVSGLSNAEEKQSSGESPQSHDLNLTQQSPEESPAPRNEMALTQSPSQR